MIPADPIPQEVLEAARTIQRFVEENGLCRGRILGLRFGSPHCVTCQCENLHAKAPVPDNPHSKSWHDNAANSPEEAQRR